MQLLIETGNGLSVRNIAPAMPLRLRERQGKEAENATHNAAALWGLADFVFRPEVRRLSSGVRELGDGVLLVGDLGVVVQVKSREIPTGNADRERAWLEKQCKKALRQGAGTIRQLQQRPAPMTNLRGRTIEVDGNDFRWVTVVVLGHDDPPNEVAPRPSENAVILLRRDWEFLFEQLKSTHAVGRYLERVAGDPQELGSEPVRYYEFAAADLAAAPTPLKPAFRMAGIQEVSEPLLPMAPAASEDKADHYLFRSILEDIAEIKMETMSESSRIKALADLDHLPVEQRALVGRYLRNGFDNACSVKGPEVLWHLRRISGGFGSTQLGFGVCSQFNEEIQWAFGTWLQLRHHEFTERVAADDPVSVGLLLTPRRDGKRPWDTTMSAIRGRIELTEAELAAYVELWHREQDIAA